MSPSVLLRQATRADLGALAALEAACFTHPWSEAQLAEEVAVAAPGGVFLLEGRLQPGEGAAICAYCAFRLVLDEMHVMNVAVAPKGRRRGLARRLLRFALRRAARAGARTAFLELRAGNREAMGLYQSLGFRPVSRRREYYRQPIEDALVLALQGLGVEGADPEPES